MAPMSPHWQCQCLTHSVKHARKRHSCRFSLAHSATGKNYSWHTCVNTVTDIVGILIFHSIILRPCTVHLKTQSKKALSRGALVCRVTWLFTAEAVHTYWWLTGWLQGSSFLIYSHHLLPPKGEYEQRDEEWKMRWKWRNGLPWKCCRS